MPLVRLADLMDELRESGATAGQMAIVANIIAVCLMPAPTLSGAERTRRWRERSREESDEVTSRVTQKEKVAPKEKLIPPDTLRVSTPKGTRLPDPWDPPENLWLKAKQDFGLSDETLRFETSAFRDHFWSSARANATKRDWGKAWMNWMREAWRREQKHKPKVVPFRPSGPKKTWAEIKAEKSNPQR